MRHEQAPASAGHSGPRRLSYNREIGVKGYARRANKSVREI